MRIRTFMGDTMAEALAEAREALGDDAVVISTKEGKRGQRCEVRAAVDDAAEQITTRTLPVEDPLRTKLFAQMEQELAELRALHGQMARAEDEAPQFSDADIVSALKFHRFSADIAKTIFREAKAANAHSLDRALGTAFEKLLPFAPVTGKETSPIMLVGTPGVGKTVATAKLLARSIATGAPMSCFTTDTLKSGAVEQLSHYCKLMGQRLRTSDTPRDLHRQVNGAAALIDSPGINPYREAEVADLRQFLNGTGAEPVLVLAAGQDAEEQAETTAVFAALGVKRAIVTRLDSARRMGSVLGTLAGNGLGLAHVSASPFLAEGFSPLSHKELGVRLVEATSPQDPLQAPSKATSQERAAS